MEPNGVESRSRKKSRNLIAVLAVLVTLGALGLGYAEEDPTSSSQAHGPNVIEVHAKHRLSTSWNGFRAVLSKRGNIERIEALAQHDKSKIVPMTQEEETCTIPAITNRSRLIAEDFNFDGYLDLGVLCAAGATGYLDYSVWLWDPKEEVLRYSPDFSRTLEHIKFVSVNPSKETVTTVAGDLQSRDERTYTIVNGKPLLSYSRHGDVDKKDGVWHVTIRKREGGRMVVIERRKTRSLSPW